MKKAAIVPPTIGCLRDLYQPARWGPHYYSRSDSDTSVAAPIVADGATLLYDAAYTRILDNAVARDPRVIKSILMNSEYKTVDWDNGQVSHPNGNGGVMTTQGLDNLVGAGRWNLDKAYDQYLRGTTDVIGANPGNQETVEIFRWDFGNVVEGITND